MVTTILNFANNSLRIVLLVCGTLAIATQWASAEWQSDFPRLRIAVLESSLIARDPVRKETVRQAFANHLKLRVDILPMVNYAALIDAAATGRVHYAAYSAKAFAAANALCRCVEPLARPKSIDGMVGFRSVLVLGEGISLDRDQMADKSIGYTSRNSTSGWQIPSKAVASGSLPNALFQQLGSPEAVVMAFVGNEIDGFFGWLPEYEGSETNGSGNSLFAGLFDDLLEERAHATAWQSEVVPLGPHAVHDSMPEEGRKAVREFLLEMHEKAPGLYDILEPNYGGGFVPSLKSDYRVISSLVKESAN